MRMGGMPYEIGEGNSRQNRELIPQGLWLIEKLALGEVHRPYRWLGLLARGKALINGYCVRCEPEPVRLKRRITGQTWRKAPRHLHTPNIRMLLIIGLCPALIVA
jgi:hypothetical protein